jgi:hypothetical protein
MFVCLGINVVAAEKALDRAVVTTRVTGLIAGRKCIVNIAFEPKRLPADGVYDRVAIPPKLRILRLKALNSLEGLGGCVILEGLTEKVIETFSAPGSLEAVFDCSQRG